MGSLKQAVMDIFGLISRLENFYFGGRKKERTRKE
jgi:hypothetical protein